MRLNDCPARPTDRVILPASPLIGKMNNRSGREEQMAKQGSWVNKNKGKNESRNKNKNKNKNKRNQDLSSHPGKPSGCACCWHRRATQLTPDLSLRVWRMSI